MLTERTVVIPIYKYKLRIVVFDSMQEVADKYHVDIGSGCDGLLVDYGDKAMICVPSNNMKVVVHECEHAKNAIWLRIGHTPVPNNDEVDAYLIETIWEEVNRTINKHLVTHC